MLALIALTLVFIVGPLIGLGPVIIRKPKSGGRNNALWVTLPPDSGTLSVGQSPRGRKAQEITDIVHRWTVALLICWGAFFFFDAPADLSFSLDDAGFALAALMIAGLYSEIFPCHFDAVGHENEIIVAQREGDWPRAQELGPDYYRTAETSRVQQQSHFDHMSYDETRRFMANRAWIARLFRRALARRF